MLEAYDNINDIIAQHELGRLSTEECLTLIQQELNFLYAHGILTRTDASRALGSSSSAHPRRRQRVNTTMYMIAECIGGSIYEQHTIPYVYTKREWAEHQLRILERDAEDGVTYKIRTVTLVTKGPELRS